jgi:hypothetical protein
MADGNIAVNIYILADRLPGHPGRIPFVNPRGGAIVKLVSMTDRQGRAVVTVRVKVTARHARRQISSAFVVPLDNPLR